MWKAPASILCLATLPLLGCAGNYTARQSEAVMPMPAAESPGYPTYYAPPASVYAASPAAPAAVLVFLPGSGAVASDPALWEAQGFDVVTSPPDIYRLVADQEAAMARLIASAEALANAPVWLVGPDQAIEAAMPQIGGRISGIIVTSETSPAYSCSESFSYYNPGTGEPPQVKVTRSGDCGAAGIPSISGRQPSVVAPAPAPQPNTRPLIETRNRSMPGAAPRPRIIEASAAAKNLPPAAQVHRLAEMIKSVPPS
jgi:hypothetical protein